MRYRRQGYTALQAKYLMRPYDKTGQHFIYQSFLDRRIATLGRNSFAGRSLSWYKDSPLNLIRGRSMSIGRFYEYHARLHATPKFGIRQQTAHTWAIPRNAGGGRWRYANVVDPQAPWGRIGYIIHGSPLEFKLAAGATVAAPTGTGGYVLYRSLHD